MENNLKKEKNVKVRITTNVDGGEFVTEAKGEYAHDDETHYVAYTEHVENGLTRSGLHVGRDKLLLHRDGAVVSQMLFDPARDTHAAYSTMGMEMSFVVHTDQYDVLFEDDRFTIDLRYTLRDGSGSEPTPYRLRIEVIDA